MPEAHCPMLHAQMVMAIARCTIGIWKDRQRPQHHARGSLLHAHGQMVMAHGRCTIGIWKDRHGHCLMPEAHCSMHHAQMVMAIASCAIGIWNDRQRPQHHARGSLPDAPRPDGHGHCLMYHWHLERQTKQSIFEINNLA